uniref:Kirola-like n=1 Tax=Nicotiana sylvestris TaxID=4096 RepID=A0A1U7W7G8_NICSY|nr:PREDICTED: kirola-like [Nicotiana sylvestris]
MASTMFIYKFLFLAQKIEGQEKVVKVVVEAIDEEKRLVTFKAFEGHLIEQYKAFKATVHIENEGENNLGLWNIEYEKQNDDVSEPFSYLELVYLPVLRAVLKSYMRNFYG